MSSVYAMSDIHGGQDNYGVPDRIIELECKYSSDKIIALAGNHGDMAIDGESHYYIDIVSIG